MYSGAASFGVTSYTFYSLNITAQNYQPRSETIEVDASNQNARSWLLSQNEYTFVRRRQKQPGTGGRRKHKC